MIQNFRKFQYNLDEFGGIFALDDVSFVTPEGTVGGPSNPDMFSPNFKHRNAKDGTYSARIRFVPNINDRNLSKIDKYIYYLPDASGGDQSFFYVDCPSNLGQRNNIISTAYFTLKDMEHVHLKNVAKKYFQRKQYFFSLVQIMKDIQEPDTVGKIKIFRFGSVINKMIEELEKGDPSVGKPSVKVFDLFKGRDLFLKQNEKTYDDNGTQRKMTSYDDSSFDGNSTGISFDGGETRLVLTGDSAKDTETMQKIAKYLKDESPDLNQMVAKAWDEEMTEKVIASVRNLINDEVVFNEIYNKSLHKGTRNHYKAPSPTQSTQSPAPTQQAAPQSTAPQAQTVKEEKENLANSLAVQKEPTVVTESKQSDSENLDDIDFDKL